MVLGPRVSQTEEGKQLPLLMMLQHLVYSGVNCVFYSFLLCWGWWQRAEVLAVWEAGQTDYKLPVFLS